MLISKWRKTEQILKIFWDVMLYCLVEIYRCFGEHMLSPSSGSVFRARKQKIAFFFLLACTAYTTTLKMKAAHSSETSVSFYQTTYSSSKNVISAMGISNLKNRSSILLRKNNFKIHLNTCTASSNLQYCEPAIGVKSMSHFNKNSICCSAPSINKSAQAP
jgi:hypothetical protein